MGRESEESGEREGSELGVRGEREWEARGKRVGCNCRMSGKRVERENGSHKDYASSR